GNWLLDPTDVTIVAGADKNVSNDSNVFTPSDNGAQIGVGSIQSQLNNGANVTIKTSGHDTDGQRGNITFAKDAKIKKTGGTDATLTLKADGNITFADRKWSGLTDTTNGAITSTSGKLNLNLLAGNDGQNSSVTIGKFVHFFLNDGDFSAGPSNSSGGVTSLSFLNAGLISAGNINLDTAGGTSGYAYTLNATNDLTVNGNLSVNTGSGLTAELKSGRFLNITTASGGMQFNATDTNQGGSILINGQDGVNIRTDNGTLVMRATGSNNKISVTSDKGSVNLSGKVQDGGDGLNFTGVDIRSKDSVTLSGTTFWGRATVLAGLNVSAGGDVNISGTAQRLSDGKPGSSDATEGLTITGSKITSDGGNISMSGLSASKKHTALDVRATDITADKDISLNASRGGVRIEGTDSTSGMANIVSNNGNIRISGNATGSDDNGVSLRFVNLIATDGITVTGVGSSGVEGAGSTTQKYWNSNPDARAGTGIMWRGKVTFSSARNELNGSNIHPSVLSGVTAAGMIFLQSDVTFTGDTTINASSDYGTGMMFNDVYGSSSSLKFSDGTAVINAKSINPGTGSAHYGGGVSVYTWGGAPQTINMSVSNATLNISASAQDVDGIASFRSDGEGANDGSRNHGYRFSGDGDVNINASSVSGNGVELRILDNTDLKGNFTVNGQSQSGAGVIVSEFANVTVHNATITGSSETGTGIQINAADRNTHQVNLSGNTLTGTSGTGTGININGNKVTITNGSLNGTSDGSGAGVLLTGGTDYTVDGATVSGQSQAGSGVSVGGNLSVSNATVSGDTATGSGVNISGDLTSSNTTITGNASDNGSGVLLTGSVTGDDTGKNVITGSSAQGDGLLLSGEPAVTEVTLNGSSEDGDGIKVTGNLTTNNVVATGNASGDGSGISMAGNISGGQWTGNAANGTGVNISGDSTLTDVSLSGTTTTGTGVGVSGNLTTNNVVATGSASGNGSGLSMAGNISGGQWTGDAASGTGVNVTGDSTLTDVSLSGTTESGTGVNVGGNLTNAGSTTVNGSASGNGTGTTVGGSLNGDIDGSSVSGTGSAVNGTVNGAIKGTSESGTGAVVNGTINGMVQGISDSGTGVTVHGMVNGMVDGTSTSGTGAVVGDGADITQGSQVNGRSGTGTGSATEGSVTNQGSISGQSDKDTGTVLRGNLSGNGQVTGTTNGPGDGVNLSGNVSGGTVTGNAVNGTGLNISGDSTLTDVTLNGNTTSGTGVNVAGSLTNTGSTTVSGNASDNGTGLHVRAGIDIAGGYLTGRAASGPAVVIDGENTLTRTTVSGSSGSNSGLLINGVVMNLNSSLEGLSESGAGVSLNGTVTGGSLSGQSENGAGVHVTGNSTVSGVTVNASSENGQGLQLDGVLSTAGDTTLNGVVQGDSFAERQQVYSLQNRMSQDDRHLQQVVSSSGYREQERPVGVDICTDGEASCRHLNAGMSDRPSHP
ncbi:TPA: beta strand repeat-containing protein, partial [Salmonella enterica subsp. enterica serovar Muenchen]